MAGAITLVCCNMKLTCRPCHRTHRRWGGMRSTRFSFLHHHGQLTTSKFPMVSVRVYGHMRCVHQLFPCFPTSLSITRWGILRRRFYCASQRSILWSEPFFASFDVHILRWWVRSGCIACVECLFSKRCYFLILLRSGSQSIRIAFCAFCTISTWVCWGHWWPVYRYGRSVGWTCDALVGFCKILVPETLRSFPHMV